MDAVTGRKTVTVPPACAWQYFAENRPPFFNQVTGSAQWHTPQALSWKHLRVIDADSCPAAAESTLSENSYQRSVDFYWNWRTNASRPTSQRPHELGHGLGLDLMVSTQDNSFFSASMCVCVTQSMVAAQPNSTRLLGSWAGRTVVRQSRHR